MSFRKERDALGPVQVPDEVYYGASTQRAVENFPISGLTIPLPIIHAMAMIKKHAAHVNHRLGLLPVSIKDPILAAAREIQAGSWDDQFPVDVFQTGSGTSTNMNVNEVIAGRANELLTGKRGGKSPVHPNDHVNLGQSSNDVFPTALHIATVLGLRGHVIPSLVLLHECLLKKSEEFREVVKIGRTHVQDAVPVTLGQEFSGYARQVQLGVQRVQAVQKHLSELPLGGTAVGTGVGAHPLFAGEVIDRIVEETGHAFLEAENHFEAQAARDAAVEASGALRTLAVSLSKIAHDLRWLASGPRSGLGEIMLPSLQPGSSIMPGKVNPVIPEAVIQVCAQVQAGDLAVVLAGQGGTLELNVMMPLLGHSLLHSIHILGNAARLFAVKCVEGIVADRKICAANVERSLALATYLVPSLGYDRAAALAREAYERGETVREAALRSGTHSQEELKEILDEGILRSLFQ